MAWLVIRRMAMLMAGNRWRGARRTALEMALQNAKRAPLKVPAV
ncbi:hypothetical protein ACUN9V_11560 [Salinicola sp. V024]